MSLSASVAGTKQDKNRFLLFIEFLKTYLSHWLKRLLTYQHVLITKQEQQETKRLEQTRVLATLTFSSLIQKFDIGPSSTTAAVQSEGIFELYLGKVGSMARWRCCTPQADAAARSTEEELGGVNVLRCYTADAGRRDGDTVSSWS